MKRFIKLIIIIFCLSPTLSFAGMATLSDRAEVRQFIQTMVNQYNFNGPQLVNIFKQVKIRNDILGLMRKPKEASPWYRYQQFFITDKRINDGVKFWNQHDKTLVIAEKNYGVPASIIVAIIGVETHYGQSQGKYRVIDALSTLAFNYPPRAKFFKQELAQYFLLAREQNFNPFSVMGSYAGAIGVPQFMPSSYRNYAVSSQGNHKIDLANNTNDAIISIANYFKKYGWQNGQPIIVPAKITSNRAHRYITNSMQAKFNWGQLANNGVRIDKPVASKQKVSLIQLQGPHGYQYYVAFNNFYVITRYNNSLNYALAVYELGQRIQARRNYH